MSISDYVDKSYNYLTVLNSNVLFTEGVQY